MKNYNLHALVEGPKSPEDMEETIFGDTCEVSAAIAGMAIAGLIEWSNKGKAKIQELQQNQRIWLSLDAGTTLDEAYFANYVLFEVDGKLYFGAEYTGCAQPELEFQVNIDELIDNLAKWGLLSPVRQMLLSVLDSIEFNGEWDTRYNLRIDPSVKILTIDELFNKVYIAAMAKYK